MATVLVVDDSAENRLLVKTVLTYAGHTVVEATDGAEALTRAAEDLPDLILLDLSLPTMSGTQFARALRANPLTAATNVALYTATTMNSALRDFMEMYGIRSLVPKPSAPPDLLAAVELALNG